MKKIAIVSLLIILVVFLLHLVLFAFVNTKGKDILIRQVKKNLGLDIIINSLAIKFPFDIEVRGVRFADLELEMADISLVWFNPFARHLTLDKVSLSGLKTKVTLSKDGIFIDKFCLKDLSKDITLDSEGAKGAVKTEEVTTISTTLPKHKKAKKSISLTIKKIQVINSKVVINYLNNQQTIAVILDRIELNMRNFNYPALSNFYIKFSSDVTPALKKEEDNDIRLKAEGWIDYLRKNMDLSLAVDNFNYLSFGDYYPSFWKPENLYITEAVLSLASKLTAKNNDLIIDNQLFLEKIAFKEFKEDEDVSAKVKTLTTIIALLKGDKEKASLRFSIKTKMDSPKLDLNSLQETFKQAVPIMPAVILGEAVDKVKQKVGETVEKTGKVAVDTVVDTIKSVVDTISEKFSLPADSKKEESQETPRN